MGRDQKTIYKQTLNRKIFPVSGGGNMGIRHLAEAIILQSIEDLWNELQRENCKTFFSGDGFSICARIAGMGLSDQEKLLSLLDGLIIHKKIPVKNPQRKNYKCIFC